MPQTGRCPTASPAACCDVLPNASFIGFTGTPIEQNDPNTRAVFGEYVSVGDIQQAVIEKATVPIYYESRIAKLSLNEAELPKVIPSSRKPPKGKTRIACKSSRPSGPRKDG